MEELQSSVIPSNWNQSDSYYGLSHNTQIYPETLLEPLSFYTSRSLIFYRLHVVDDRDFHDHVHRFGFHLLA